MLSYAALSKSVSGWLSKTVSCARSLNVEGWHMKPTTVERIDKAEGDFATAQVPYRTRKRPNHDAVCFHAQHCAEKYLKARLEEAGVLIPRTHNLHAMLTLLLPIDPASSALAPD